MSSDSAYVDAEIRPYTDGLWGDAASVQTTLARLEHGLTRDLLTFGVDGAALLRAGEIAVARTELPVAERMALVEGVLHLHMAWMERPLHDRRIAYPLLDALAADASLPAYLRSDALTLLEAEARRCTERLIRDLAEPPPWQGNPGARGPEDALFARVGVLPLVHNALDLLQRPALAARWQGSLVKVVAMAADDLLQELQADGDFAIQPAPHYLLAVLLASPWLPDARRAEGQQFFDRFVASVAASAQSEQMSEDTLLLAAGVLEWPSVPEALRAQLAACVQQRPVRITNHE